MPRATEPASQPRTKVPFHVSLPLRIPFCVSLSLRTSVVTILHVVSEEISPTAFFLFSPGWHQLHDRSNGGNVEAS